MLGDGCLSLLLGADEEDRAAFDRDVTGKVNRLGYLKNGLTKVDDVDSVALPVDIGAHLGVPTSGLMTEMDAGLQELLHCDFSHNWGLLSGYVPPPVGSGPTLERGAPSSNGLNLRRLDQSGVHERA